MHNIHFIEIFVFLFTNFAYGFEPHPNRGVNMGSRHGVYSVNGTATSFFSLQNFKSKAVWQNEIFIVVGKTARHVQLWKVGDHS